MYLYPERFKTMRTGAKTTGIPDVELVQVLDDASSIVDAYCNVPLSPAPHDFLGGRAEGEQHEWRYPTTLHEPGSRRVWPFHWPVVDVETFRLVLTGQAGSTISTDGLVVDNVRRFIEVVSAGLVTGGLFGVAGLVVPNIGLENPICEITYTYGWDFGVSEERVYPVGDDNLIFQTRHGNWTADDIEVTVGGVVTASGFTVDREEGRLTFDADPDDIVRVSYHHKLPRDLEHATAKIAGFLLGGASLAAKGATGVRRITAGEITIERQQAPHNIAQYLDSFVPDAALQLSGFRYWRAA